MPITFTEELQKLKLKSGPLLYPVETWVEMGRRFFKFPYNVYLKDQIKAMEGAQWDPASKIWHVVESQRNQFQLRHLACEPVFANYDAPLNFDAIPKKRFNRRANKELDLFKHQIEGTAFYFQRHFSILAEEMGLGKTLQSLIAAEMILEHFEAAAAAGWWYVAPKSALYSVQRDLDLWGAKIQPMFFTYEMFTKELKNWTAGRKAPFHVTFDEFSRCKNYNTQRSQAAKAIADGVRQDWGLDGYVVGMTGTPSPKSPADWWSLAEIICPGFLVEGNIHKFKNRLAIITMKEGIDGGSYPQLLSWRDDSKKCNICGELAGHGNHTLELLGTGDERIHCFVESKNEVALLAKRLKGLVLVFFKKDCLDLPDKYYRVITCKPKPSILRAASLILKSSKTTIEGLTRLRELSDGFQYVDVATGVGECPLCKGAKQYNNAIEIPDSCPACILGKTGTQIRDGKFDIKVNCGNHTPKVRYELQSCPNCGGSGQVKTFDRTTKEASSPKDDVLDQVLDEYEDVGRVVVYGGFTGTIDRVVAMCHRRGWYVIRMDGRGIQITDPKSEVLALNDFQAMFQDQLATYDKVAFVAHPKSGGMGLTLTASPVILYYSNDFDAEARIQSEDRIHRPGMDTARGATIIDIIHLETDQKVLDNLKKKKDLQAMSLGDFQFALNSEGERPE